MSKLNKKLSIIIPVYNEKYTIQKLLNKIYKLRNLKKEIIVINDASTDGTKEILEKNKKKITHLVNHKKNQGKGAAIQTAQKLVQGDIVLIQDGDLEYEPSDYHKLLKEIYNGNKVVYGSRVLGKKRYLTHNFSSILRVFYNHVLTIISNILNNQDLTDAHTCYKMFQSSIFLKIKLKEKDFSFFPEITTKIELKILKLKRYQLSTMEEVMKRVKKLILWME